jgi:hypothetical protein
MIQAMTRLVVAVHVGLAQACVVAHDDLAEEVGPQHSHARAQARLPAPLLSCTHTHRAWPSHQPCIGLLACTLVHQA